MTKKSFIWAFLAMLVTAAISISFTACSSDDDDNGGGDPSGDVAGLVSETAPSLGWSGDMQNGTVTYCPRIVDNSDAEDEYDMDAQTYYAFDFKDGKCQAAVFDMICPSEKLAKQLETAFRDGTWATMDDEYDVRRNTFLQRVKEQVKVATRAGSDNSLQDLALLVYRNGRVIYILIDCLKGKSGDDVQSLVLYWEGKSAIIPNNIIAGTWDDQTGIYTNNYILAWGITYRINTVFENNLLKDYVTTMTFPNQTLAEVMYQAIEEQNRQIGAQTGLYPKATLDGKTLKEIAVIYGDLTKEQTLQLITAIDWMLSRPFFISLCE